jgi:hypothetical protein
MAKTLREVWLESGLTPDQIDNLDAKIIASGNTYIATVEKAAADKEKAAQDLAVKAEADRKAQEAAVVAAKAAQDAAELQNRSVKDFWDNTYNPGIAAAEAEKTRLAKEAADAKAEAAFYKAQRESYLGTLNIKPEDAPVFTPPVAVVPPAAKTPGTPTFTIDEVRNELGTSLGTVANIQWEYRNLYGGKEMPISPTELLRQAEANKFKDPATYANQIFKFAEKREEMRQAAAKAHDDSIAAAAVAEREAKYKEETDKLKAEFAAKERLRAEQAGSNPDVKLPPGSSKFSDLQRATKAGERPDPLKMTQAERRQTSLNNIHKALEERQQAVA